MDAARAPIMGPGPGAGAGAGAWKGAAKEATRDGAFGFGGSPGAAALMGAVTPQVALWAFDEAVCKAGVKVRPMA